MKDKKVITNYYEKIFKLLTVHEQCLTNSIRKCKGKPFINGNIEQKHIRNFKTALKNLGLEKDAVYDLAGHAGIMEMHWLFTHYKCRKTRQNKGGSK